MKLYASRDAPSPLRVLLYVAEKNAERPVIALSEVPVDLSNGEQRQPEHLARNAFGKLPVLETDDGTILTESLAIIEYLEELHPAPPMLGTTPLERAQRRALDRVAELRVFFPLGRLVHVSPQGRAPDPSIAEHYRSHLPIGLSWLERQLSDERPFLGGARPSVADCTLAAVLAFAARRGISVLDDYARLATWNEKYRERPWIAPLLE